MIEIDGTLATATTFAAYASPARMLPVLYAPRARYSATLGSG
jgi:hypothetical protein